MFFRRGAVSVPPQAPLWEPAASTVTETIMLAPSIDHSALSASARQSAARARSAAVATLAASVLRGLRAIAARWSEECALRRAEAELAALSDRQLADIGLHRSQIARCVRFGRPHLDPGVLGP